MIPRIQATATQPMITPIIAETERENGGWLEGGVEGGGAPGGGVSGGLDNGGGAAHNDKSTSEQLML